MNGARDNEETIRDDIVDALCGATIRNKTGSYPMDFCDSSPRAMI